MNLKRAEKLNTLRKLSLILAFVLTFTQMPQTGMIMAYALPVQESVSAPDSEETADENTEPASGDEKAVSGSEEESVSAGSISGDAAGESEDTVSPDQVKTEGEDAAGDLTILVTSWNGLQEAFDMGGVVQLENSIDASESDNELVVPLSADVTLDLNGKNLYRGKNINSEPYTESGRVIRVQGKLTIKNSNSSENRNGHISGGKSKFGGGIMVDGGALTLINGNIDYNEAEYGGAVYVKNGSFDMKGGRIIVNTSEEDGAGVYIYGNSGTASFNMSGGLIEKNIITGENGWGGGVYVRAENGGSACMNMSGSAMISGNEAADGAGVCVSGGDDSTVSFNMTDGSINDNHSADWAGGVYVGGYGGTVKQFNMTGGKIENNSARYGGAVYAHGNGGTVSVNLTGGDISGNQASEQGGGVMVLSEKSDGSQQAGKAYFTMDGGSIKNNTASGNGGGIGTGIKPGCTTVVTLNNGSIENNTSQKSGGGVYVDTCTFNMNGGRITGNTAVKKGGGVYNASYTGAAAFTMNGGRIGENKAENGGGVYTYNEGEKSQADFTLNAGDIDDNKAEYGGGVYVNSRGKDGSIYGSTTRFTMNDGNIINNTAVGDGGGIYSTVWQNCWTIVNVKNGNIRRNSAKNGGGIFSYWNRLFLTGGDITENHALENGGGVNVNCAQLTLSGGNIQENTASGNGGGVYARFYETATWFKVSGNFEIKGNNNGSGVSSNVCIANENSTAEDFKIGVTGKLENTAPVGVKAIDYKTGELTGGVITTGLSGNGDLRHFSGEGSTIRLNAKGEIEYVIPLTGISITPVSANVEIGKTVPLTVNFTPSGANNKNVTWTVNDSKIATVANGVVTGVSAGSAVVTAKSEDGGFTASCTVTVTKTEPEPEPPVPVDPEKTYYTVTFMDGDNKIASQIVEDGKTLTKPAKDPVKEGYEFMGWAKGTTIWNFSTPIHSGFTLYAKYIAKTPEAVSENTGSGMDPVAKVEKTDKGKVIYLVKGQTYTAGGSGWSIKSGGGITVVRNTGKITAKKKGHYIVEHDGEEITVAVAAPQFEKSQKTRSVMVGNTGWISLNINAESTDESRYFPVTWATENPAIATVADGTITALAKGSTKAYAYCGGKTYTAKITVTDTFKAPGTQKRSTVSVKLNPLQSVNLKFDRSVFVINGASWNSVTGPELVPTKNSKTGNPDGGYTNGIITITKAGKITAVGSYKDTIQIHGSNKGKDVYVFIDVINVPSSENTYININRQTTVKFPFVKNNAAAWFTLNKDVIPEVKNGKVKGKAVGCSTISCNYNRFDFRTLVYVEDPKFRTDDKLKLENNKYVLNLKKGDVYNRVQMDNVFQTVQYKSSKTAVAFIDENGVIYARGKGKANITTKINGKTYKIAVTVTE